MHEGYYNLIIPFLVQAAKTTSIGEEAISNIRTVRAFAMENQECELFCQQLEEASRLNQRLGFGIGLFQVLTGCLNNKWEAPSLKGLLLFNSS